LISNGWDAGADTVEVVVPTDLEDEAATLCVLDNGSSMDEDGLRQLWRIAFSPKTAEPIANGRPVIGKFGIGKLATYVLANKLTYICRAADGKVRRVTMDFGNVDKNADPTEDRLISDMELEVYELTDGEVAEALASISDGERLADIIKAGIPKPVIASEADEFRSPPDSYVKPLSDTWTLSVLSHLKPTGRDIKAGVLKRVLRSALPFGSEMVISLNGEALASSKVGVPIANEWIVGPELGITQIALELPPKVATDGTVEEQSEVLTLAANTRPYIHVDIPGIGPVTGTVYLFKDKISGGRSDEVGASNGFHVNVLGRIVNLADPAFGEKNLSHSAWSKFRMVVRADGLNAFITTDREKFKDCREVQAFRAFLRRVFNKVRSDHDKDANAALPDGGDVLVKSLGIVSLAALRNVVSDALSQDTAMPEIFDSNGVTDRGERLQAWRASTSEDIGNAVKDVKYEKVDSETLVRFRLSDNTIVVNSQHPFALEHSRSRAEKELVRTVGMVNLLTDVYALDAGVDSRTLIEIMAYRDKLMRFRSLERRKSGAYIARLLLQMGVQSSSSKRLEAVLSDALRYLGFDVEDLASRGEPEGVARAYPLPTNRTPSDSDGVPPLYSFTFDAKTSADGIAATGNLNLDGIVEHRNRYDANYALVVAPGFQSGAVSTRCTELSVTPMCAKDLGKLLEYTAECGAMPLETLRGMFELHDPGEVSTWVESLKDWAKQHRPLTIDVFLRALHHLSGKIPDIVSANTISYVCRTELGVQSVQDVHVLAIARGLAILVPDLVGVDGDKIAVNASAERVAAAVRSQLDKLHDDFSSEEVE
jgi:hypothetical protein